MKLIIEFDISIEEAIAIADWHRARSKEDAKEHEMRYPFPPGSPAGEVFAEETEYYGEDELPKDWIGNRVDYKNPEEAPHGFLFWAKRGYVVVKDTEMTATIAIHTTGTHHEVVKEKLKVRKPARPGSGLHNFTMAG